MLQLKFFIKYLQPYTMKIFSFIFSSLSFYMSLGAIFNEHSFRQEKKRKKKEKKKKEITKGMRH